MRRAVLLGAVVAGALLPVPSVRAQGLCEVRTVLRTFELDRDVTPGPDTWTITTASDAGGLSRIDRVPNDGGVVTVDREVGAMQIPEEAFPVQLVLATTVDFDGAPATGGQHLGLRGTLACPGSGEARNVHTIRDRTSPSGQALGVATLTYAYTVTEAVDGG